jgi:hypothetical protein
MPMEGYWCELKADRSVHLKDAVPPHKRQYRQEHKVADPSTA